MINSLSHIDSHLTLKNKFASNKSLSAMKSWYSESFSIV